MAAATDTACFVYLRRQRAFHDDSERQNDNDKQPSESNTGTNQVLEAGLFWPFFVFSWFGRGLAGSSPLSPLSVGRSSSFFICCKVEGEEGREWRDYFGGHGAYSLACFLCGTSWWWPGTFSPLLSPYSTLFWEVGGLRRGEVAYGDGGKNTIGFCSMVGTTRMEFDGMNGWAVWRGKRVG